VRVELGAVEQLRRFVGEQALEPEQQREVAAPLDRGVLGAGVDLGQGGIGRAVPSASASGPSPSSRKGSRAKAAARSISAPVGTAAFAATSLVLAIEALGSVLASALSAQRRASGNEDARKAGLAPRRSQRARNLLAGQTFYVL
jgi:hypothetical protein